MRRIILLSIIILCTFTQCKKPIEIEKNEVPVAPTNLVVKAISSTAILLSWSDNSNNETGFKIERKTGTEAYKTIHTTVANVETYHDSLLNPDNAYNYKVSAFNAVGGSKVSSNEASVTTNKSVALPKFSETPLTISSITDRSAVANVPSLVNDGGANISARGLVWGLQPDATISSPGKTSNGVGIGSFQGDMTGLAVNAYYFVRAYATNSVGTSYGPEYGFRTSILVPPYCSDTISAYPGSTTATIYIGKLISEGNSPLISRGIIWGTHQNPSINLPTQASSTDQGYLKFDIKGLVSKQVYFVREFATNKHGTTYGREIKFTTTSN